MIDWARKEYMKRRRKENKLCPGLKDSRYRGPGHKLMQKFIQDNHLGAVRSYPTKSKFYAPFLGRSAEDNRELIWCVPVLGTDKVDTFVIKDQKGYQWNGMIMFVFATDSDSGRNIVLITKPDRAIHSDCIWGNPGKTYFTPDYIGYDKHVWGVEYWACGSNIHGCTESYIKEKHWVSVDDLKAIGNLLNRFMVYDVWNMEAFKEFLELYKDNFDESGFRYQKNEEEVSAMTDQEQRLAASLPARI